MSAANAEIRITPQVTPFAQVGNPHVLLVGRPPIADYLGFIKLCAIGGETLSNEDLAREWRSANDRVKELQNKEAGIANDVARQPLPPAMVPLAEAISQDPVIRKVYGNVPFTIEMVELDTLVVYQKHINLSYVEELKARLGPNPTPESIFRICFPLDEQLPPLHARRISNNVFVFVSPSNDLRFLECAFLPASQLCGYQPQGRIPGVIALSVGFGTNCFNAIGAEGRLILNNASHRAFALRDLGVTHAPCLIQHVTRREEFPIIFQPELVEQIDIYLKDPRPPLLKDYFDDQLRKLISVPNQNRQVRVTFLPEVADV